jgi:hypothetical protein
LNSDNSKPTDFLVLGSNDHGQTIKSNETFSTFINDALKPLALKVSTLIDSEGKHHSLATAVESKVRVMKEQEEEEEEK